MHRNMLTGGGRVVAALGLIALGTVPLFGFSAIWPLTILAPGLVFLAMSSSGGRRTAPFAIPGMLVAGTGALLFFQNLTGHWVSWSYAWTLYGVFLGLGFILMGKLMGDDTLPAVGRGFVKAGVIGFVAFAFLMEVVFNAGGAAWLLSALLIAGGLILLARTLAGQQRHAGRKIKRKRREDALFTGPIVYGSRVVRSSNGSRMVAPEQDDLPARPRGHLN